MNYHRAVKQWNTLGGQQKKRVGLDEVWAMPRRGTKAQEEVREIQQGEERPRLQMRRPKVAPRIVPEEKVEAELAEERFQQRKTQLEKRLGTGQTMTRWFAQQVMGAEDQVASAPAPAPRMGRPRIAPPMRAPETEGWSTQWLLPEKIRTLRTQKKPIPLRMKYRELKDYLTRVIDVSNKGTGDNAVRQLLNTQLPKAQIERFREMEDEYSKLQRRRTKEGTLVDKRNKARMAELSPQIEEILSEMRDLLALYHQQAKVLRGLIATLEKTLRSDGQDASNAHLRQLAEEAIGITESLNRRDSLNKIYGVDRIMVQRILGEVL